MFNSVTTNGMNATAFAICTGTSVILGLALALAYMFRNKKYSSGFVVTLALLPVMVQVVIAMVNGNIGVGVAVAGAFSLVRFRSAAGSAREIGAVFACMAIGLATGMGYVGVAAIFTALVIVLLMLYTVLRFGERRGNEKMLKITIPEGLDYNGVFDDLLEKYTSSHSLEKVRTSGMGSLYQLTYRVTLRDEVLEKEFIDLLRCRNGNLDIICGRLDTDREEPASQRPNAFHQWFMRLRDFPEATASGPVERWTAQTQHRTPPAV